MVDRLNREDAYATSERIRREGGTAAIAAGDLDRDSGADDAVDQAVAAFGGIDILVNNAGRCFGKVWSDTAPDEWNSIFNTNVSIGRSKTPSLIRSRCSGLSTALIRSPRWMGRSRSAGPSMRSSASCSASRCASR